MKSVRENKKLYFIALVPGEPVFTEIWKLKEEVRDRFSSKAALRSPPHITLLMPFKWREDREEQLLDSLTALALDSRPFNIKLVDFGAFEQRVIYVHVETSESLAKLQKRVTHTAAADWHIYPMAGSRPFRPHMTIAFRDLKKPMFFEAWEEFQHRNYAAQFLVSQITLLKHNGRTWDVYRNFEISP